MDKQEIISRTFERIDTRLGSASVAQVGGFRPPEDPLTSWFGGHFFGLPGEKQPISNGRELSSLLQIRVDELPYVPSTLKQISLLTVFIDEENLPPFDAHHGNGWIVRTYESLAELVLLPEPTFQSKIKSFPIQWKLIKEDAPDWIDVLDIVNDTGFPQAPDFLEIFEQKYQTADGTKVGGWPYYVQDSSYRDKGEFVFQIDSEYKASWMWGDAGIARFYKQSDGKWSMEWDSY